MAMFLALFFSPVDLKVLILFAVEGKICDVRLWPDVVRSLVVSSFGL
jgi:hypothetical protein